MGLGRGAHLLVAPFTAAEGGPLAGRGRGVMAEAACVAGSAAPIALEIGADRLARPIHVPFRLSASSGAWQKRGVARQTSATGAGLNAGRQCALALVMQLLRRVSADW